ncbi:MAG: exodeoxyribonuclease VII small subunit [Oscillospiraceae bacterium]|nr:exodeoxyribonuclease VII small subunit [Oscillospiraceae bacterium]
MDFENTLRSVDEIIAKLSEGDIPLEEAVEIYKKGAKQISDCRKMLENAKKDALKVTSGEDME